MLHVGRTGSIRWNETSFIVDWPQSIGGLGIILYTLLIHHITEPVADNGDACGVALCEEQLFIDS